MKLWLSRQRDGNYMLTRYQPTLCEVGDSGHQDFYMIPGEPIGIRHLCCTGVLVLFRVQLEIGAQIRVALRGYAEESDA